MRAPLRPHRPPRYLTRTDPWRQGGTGARYGSRRCWHAPVVTSRCPSPPDPDSDSSTPPRHHTTTTVVLRRTLGAASPSRDPVALRRRPSSWPSSRSHRSIDSRSVHLLAASADRGDVERPVGGFELRPEQHSPPPSHRRL
ncbi:hypothetical protein TCAP_00779 [Tolypocladium capitatum]|uniref:Uncharacterized protein n=1 Tax=Tolypocladium capitatum TaxID=45235 RepID=A0A2K3QP39_9HYPO|nr:hypothetical protein TCAP_00779 [Tolypocladium capitatum]